MKIAIQDSWPNLHENAEKEFIARFLIACDRVGVECAKVITSDDIEEFDPDLVIVTHEFSPKLTHHPTIGFQWSPTILFSSDAKRIRSILSYDGVIPGSSKVRDLVEDTMYGVTTRKRIAPFFFLPTTYRNEHQAICDGVEPRICYVGVHWDGDRHSRLFTELVKRKLCKFYGPEKSWQHVGNAYGGKIPFNGRSMLDVIATNGIALCLHKKEHLEENTPSMRLFETLSVGGIVISDQIQFAKENISDFAYFIDAKRSGVEVAEQVGEIYDKIKANPKAACERARAGKAWFDQNWCLEHKISKEIVPFAKEVAASMRPFDGSSGSKRARSTLFSALPGRRRSMPACEVIIRAGGRALDSLKQAVESIKAATGRAFKMSVLIVDYKGRDDIRAYAHSSSSSSLQVRYTRSPDTGFRSTALWHGIKSTTADYVCHLDDDDTVHPNHYDQLLNAIVNNKECSLAYSGVIKLEDDEGVYFDAENFAGPAGLVIPERRQIQFLDHFDLGRFLCLDNFIQSNAWIAKREVIQGVIGEDPRLVVGEDVLLYALLFQKGPGVFTGSATAVWHWRSNSGDNSMNAVEQKIWTESSDRLSRRISKMNFEGSRSYKEILFEFSSFNSEAFTRKNLRAVTENEVVEGGPLLVRTFAPRGFFSHDTVGLWSKDEDAQLSVLIAPESQSQKLMIELEMLASHKDGLDRYVEVSVEDATPVRQNVSSWSFFKIRIPLPQDLSNVLTIKVFSSAFIDTPADSRKLGAFIKSVSVLADKRP